MVKPEVKVIKLNSYDTMATSSPCGSDTVYCTGNCAPVQGFCTECMNDCHELD